MKREHRNNLILCLGVLVCVLPFLITIFFALPSTDDFAMTGGVTIGTLGENVFERAVTTANSFYFSWSGAGWPYWFLEVLMNPIVYARPGSHLYGLILIVTFLLWVGSLWGLVAATVEYFFNLQEKRYQYVAYMVCLLVILNLSTYTDVFYWFVGSSYLWGMTLILTALSFAIQYFFSSQQMSIWKQIWMVVFGTIGCMMFQLAVFPGLVYLACIYYKWKNGEMKRKQIIPLALWICGGISALLCPGTFVRGSEVGYESVSELLLSSLKNTSILTISGIFDLLKSPLFVLAMGSFFLLGVYKKEKISREISPIIMFGGTIITLWMTYLPFAFGGARRSYLPERYIFVFNTVSVLLFAICFLFLGSWTAKCNIVVINKYQIKKVVVILVVLSYICVFPTRYYEELPYMNAFSKLEQVEEIYNEWNWIFSYISESDEENVYIQRRWIATPIIKDPGLVADSSYSVNGYAAQYFEKKNISVIRD